MAFNLRNISLSLAAFYFIAVYNVYVGASHSNVKVSSWDVLGYYVYLPQAFIEHDPGLYDLGPLDSARVKYDLSPMLYQLHRTPRGNNIPQYSIGMAVFYLPGFLTGHLIAHLGHYPPDGYSPPYQYSQLWLNIAYNILAFWLLRKLLLRYFTDPITSLLLLVLYFGTNYYVYATGGYGMPHTYLLLLYVLLIRLTIGWHDRPGYKNSLALGFVLGWMAVCRPTEVLAALIPLLWGVTSLQTFKDKIRLLLVTHRHHSLALAAGFMLLPLLQVLYWRLYTGEFLYYSYKNPGEGFELAHPHLLQFLFSFRKGWFVYTPLMLAAVLFLLLGRHRHTSYWLPFAVFTCINVYVLSAWSNWWYATSFGQRALIQSYPVYLFGLGYWFSRVQARKPLLLVSVALTGLLVFFHLFQVWQYNRGIIDAGRMTRDYYFAVFGKTSIPAGADTLLLPERSVCYTTTPPKPSLYKATRVLETTGTFTMEPNGQTDDKMFRIPYNELTAAGHAWIRISLDLKPDTSGHTRLMLSSCMLNKRSEAYGWETHNVFDWAQPGPNGWLHVDAWYLTPELRLTSDRLNIQLEHPEQGHFPVRNFRIQVYEPRVNR